MARGAVLFCGAALMIGCVEPDPPAYMGGDPFCGTSSALSGEEQFGWQLPEKTLALTFDSGPAERTKELSTFLKDQGVLATFFINGQWVTGDFAFQADSLDHLANDGHLLANYTMTGRALSSLEPEEALAEIAETDALIAKFVPSEKLFFRSPYGDWNAKLAKSLAASPMEKYKGPVHWDIGDQLSATTAADWDCWDDEGNGKKTVSECGDLYLKEIHAKKRGIVLLHDGPPGSRNSVAVDLMRFMIPLLKLEGYKFVRLDEVPLKPRYQPPPPPPENDQNSGTLDADAGAQPPPVDPCRRR
jgi:peptidoglycan-N-acetylglucosamine deacetylase